MSIDLHLLPVKYAANKCFRLKFFQNIPIYRTEFHILKVGCKNSKFLTFYGAINVDEQKLKNPKIWFDDDMIMKPSA